MMKFVNREEEQKRILSAINGENPSFVAVYGRRRLGKLQQG